MTNAGKLLVPLLDTAEISDATPGKGTSVGGGASGGGVNGTAIATVGGPSSTLPASSRSSRGSRNTVGEAVVVIDCIGFLGFLLLSSFIIIV